MCNRCKKQVKVFKKFVRKNSCGEVFYNIIVENNSWKPVTIQSLIDPVLTTYEPINISVSYSGQDIIKTENEIVVTGEIVANEIKINPYTIKFFTIRMQTFTDENASENSTVCNFAYITYTVCKESVRVKLKSEVVKIFG